MMETFPVDDSFDEFLESMTNSYDFLDDSTEESIEESEHVGISEGESSPNVTVEISEETTTELHDEIFESQGETLEDDASATYDEVITVSETDYTPILDALSLTNGLLSALLFCFVAKWCLEKIESGIRRLLNERHY